jgi:putative mRNA 3-end processing factor
MGSNWARRFRPAATGFASGWMRMRGVRRRHSVDRGFVVSDHADWTGLNEAIKSTGAENIYTTHGYTDIFARWLKGEGYNAEALTTEFTGDSLDSDVLDTEDAE